MASLNVPHGPSSPQHSFHELDPRIEKPYQAPQTPEPTKLATNPVVARIRHSNFSPNLNVSEVSREGNNLLSKAPKVNIHRI